jgi:hypothetical protein
MSDKIDYVKSVIRELAGIPRITRIRRTPVPRTAPRDRYRRRCAGFRRARAGGHRGSAGSRTRRPRAARATRGSRSVASARRFSGTTRSPALPTGRRASSLRCRRDPPTTSRPARRSGRRPAPGLLALPARRAGEWARESARTARRPRRPRGGPPEFRASPTNSSRSSCGDRPGRGAASAPPRTAAPSGSSRRPTRGTAPACRRGAGTSSGFLPAAREGARRSHRPKASSSSRRSTGRSPS